jgi:hypothetical protein
MDKNRIEGRYRATSWHNTAKSIGLPVEVNAEVVQGSNALLPGEIPPLKRRSEVSRGRSSVRTSRGLKYARLNLETGSLDRPRRTEPKRNLLTGRRTWQTLKPDGLRRMRAFVSGSMWRFRDESKMVVPRYGETHACRNRPVRTRMPGGVGPAAD